MRSKNSPFIVSDSYYGAELMDDIMSKLSITSVGWYSITVTGLVSHPVGGTWDDIMSKTLPLVE